MENGKFGLVDAEANIVAQPTWDGITGGIVRGNHVLFSEGLIPVKKGDKWGYLNSKGQIAIQPQFDGVAPFQEGLATVALSAQGKSLIGFINKSGKYIINPQFTRALGFHEGMAMVGVGQEIRLGFIDKNGKYIIKPEFLIPTGMESNNLLNLDQLGFSDGLAPVFKDGSWGYIRRDGSFQIKPQFQSASAFSEGRAVVRLGDKVGYIDKTGNFTINPQFDGASSFSKGMAIAMVAGKLCTIDKEGKYILNPGQYRAEPAGTNHLQVTTDQGIGLMTLDGKWVLEPSPIIKGVMRVFGKAFELGLGLDRTPPDRPRPAEYVYVSIAGRVLEGKYKGSSLNTVATQMAQEQKAADEKESLAKVDQAKALFEQGQYQPALAECENALRLMPTNEGAKALKAQIEQTLSILGGK